MRYHLKKSVLKNIYHSLYHVVQILTKDSVTVFVNAIMYYKVRDATLAVANVDDYSGSARLLAATTLRNVLGTKNLGDILSERESIANEMQELLHEATEPWGVTVERVAGDEVDEDLRKGKEHLHVVD